MTPVEKLTLAAASGDLWKMSRSTVESGWRRLMGGTAGKTALISASKTDAKEVIDLLLAKGADMDLEIQVPPQERLDAAAAAGAVEVVELLLDGGDNVNARDEVLPDLL